MIFVAGEILFDIFPDYRRLGGAPFNFAFHLHKLGWPVRFASRLGQDPEGAAARAFLQQHGFDMQLMQTDSRYATGRVQVTLEQAGVPEYHILANAAYDQVIFDDAMQAALQQQIDLIYFGTLFQRTQNGFDTLNAIMAHKPPLARGFYDINLRPGCWSEQVVAASLDHTDILKLNESELEVLQGIYAFSQTQEGFVADLMAACNIEMVALTLGAQGSHLFTRAEHVYLPAHPVSHIADTVGAGDAFAAMLADGLLQNAAPQAMLSAASEFAARICGIAGAIPESADFYAP